MSRRRLASPLFWLAALALFLSGGMVFILAQDRQPAPLASGRTYVGASYEQPGSTGSGDSGSRNTIGYGRSGETERGQQIQLEKNPERVYGEIYTVSVACNEVTSNSFSSIYSKTLYGYCNWPLGFPNSAPCIEEATTFSMSGARNFLCKPGYDTSTTSHPDEITLENAPEEIYTVEVHCENVTEQFNTTYGDCDWPLFEAPSNDCIEVEARLPYGTGKDFLCKP